MIEKIIKPTVSTWERICTRPKVDAQSMGDVVSAIFRDVAINGDTSLDLYTQKFDKTSYKIIELDQFTTARLQNAVDKDLKNAIQLAYENITTFHKVQAEQKVIVETMPGVICWRESRAIQKVGLYIPGGTAPLFSTLLMLGIPAKLAGCEEIIVCSPANASGQVNDVVLYTAHILGIKRVYAVGGIQAIAAMTIGTETMPKVYKIFGPGNQYVTAAKQYAQNMGVAIDMPAGPSEVLVIADKTSNPDFVAADLLSQAEHGGDSQVMLVTDSELMINAVNEAIVRQLKELSREQVAVRALENSKAILLDSIVECLAFSNVYAPEHLILNVMNAEKYASMVINAGSVFIGAYSCESCGDYATGTNHTLPTNGYAHAYSGVSLDSFIKKITFQQVTSSGIQQLGPAVEIMAEAEGLIAHKNAVSVRLQNLPS